MANNRFLVVDRAVDALDPMAALDFVSDPGFGGITMFVGKVRDLNHDRQVVGVSYDIFEPLALVRFAAIAAETEQTIGQPVKLWIAHARGRLGIGDIAVVVAAGSKHREEAFGACRQAIEAVKHTSPIWKQEHFSDGDSVWSEGCSLCEGHSPVSEVNSYGS